MEQVVFIETLNATTTPPTPVGMSNQFKALLLSVSAVLILSNLLLFWIFFKCRYERHKFRKASGLQTIPFFLRYHRQLEEQDTRIPNARIFTNRKKKYGENLATAKLNSLIKMTSKLETLDLVPSDARVISIKMKGFRYGKLPHEFHPINRRSYGSYNAYRTFGNNRIQVTYYVQNQKSYVAGFCIYVEDENVLGSSFSEEVVQMILESEEYPDGTSDVELKKVVKSDTDIWKHKEPRYSDRFKDQDEVERIWNFEENPTKKQKSKTRKFEEFPGINDFLWV